MFGLTEITEKDLLVVYGQLKEQYALILTNTLSADEGFRMDMPILTAAAHGKILWLYVYEGEFILDVMDSARTTGTHWHPMDTEQAVRDITAFMEGMADNPMLPFRQE